MRYLLSLPGKSHNRTSDVLGLQVSDYGVSRDLANQRAKIPIPNSSADVLVKRRMSLRACGTVSLRQASPQSAVALLKHEE